MHRAISYEIPRSAALSIRPAQEPNVAADIEAVARVRLHALRADQRVTRLGKLAHELVRLSPRIPVAEEQKWC